MPATLYFPRRHRRHLLFPPGLLALAGLLWLGCVAVPRIMGPTQYVKEVGFFPLHVPADSFGGFPTPQQIEDLGPWKSITLSGNSWADHFDMKIVENAGRSLAEKQPQHRALHVYLNESTSYNTFIQLLDIPNQLGIERYFIDLRKMPYSINLLGNIPHPDYPSFICGTQYMKPIKPFSEIAEEWLTESWAAIRSPTWRNTILLLLFLTALSAWKLRRQWRTVVS
jgi:hypothetical protein